MFFKSYNGCRDIGRKGHPILSTAFTKANGERANYSESALKSILRNAPPKFSEDDYALAYCALKDIETQHLWF